ncbi:MAG: AMIN domain-containing protein [Desulfovibrio sp.]|nr:AMIN domain-containing protein [Desulfovibrio sp.]
MNKRLLAFVFLVCLVGAGLIYVNEQGRHGTTGTDREPLNQNESLPQPRKELQHTLPLENSSDAAGEKPFHQAPPRVSAGNTDPRVKPEQKDKPNTKDRQEVKEREKPNAKDRPEVKEKEKPASLEKPAPHEKPVPKETAETQKKNPPRPEASVTGDTVVSQLRPIARTEEDIRKSGGEQTHKDKNDAHAGDVSKEAEKTPGATEAEKDVKQGNRKESEKPEKPEKPKTAAAPAAISRLVVFTRDKGATIRLQGARSLSYKTSRMHDPERVLIELEGTWNVPHAEIPNNIFVKNVRVGKQNGTTRIVLDLKEAPKSMRLVEGKAGQQLDVRLDR